MREMSHSCSRIQRSAPPVFHHAVARSILRDMQRANLGSLLAQPMNTTTLLEAASLQGR